MIDNNLNDLVEPMRTKAKVLQEVFKTRFPNFAPFETLRTKARQVQLLATGHTRTLNSYHIKGLAVDRVFIENGQSTWDNSQGQYNLMQWVAAMCGMGRIKQELCHTQDNGVAIKDQMSTNSARYNNTTDTGEQYRLHLVNETFKKYVV